MGLDGVQVQSPVDLINTVSHKMASAGDAVPVSKGGDEVHFLEDPIVKVFIIVYNLF